MNVMCDNNVGRINKLQKNTKIISFINLKGGVGKTSTAINVADEFSKMGENVLVIDMDPQFNATQALLNHQFSYFKSTIPTKILDDVNEEFTKEYEKLMEENGDSTKIDIEELKKELNSQLIYNKLKDMRLTARTLYTKESIVDSIGNPNLIYNIKPNLDLIPGDLDLFESFKGDTSGKHNMLEDHLSNYEIRGKYDYIIIDCPPNWTILTQASLFASDFYIIPSKVDLFSSVGIGLLNKLVNSTFYATKSDIIQIYNMYRRNLGKEPLKSLGVLFTLTHEITVASKLKEKLIKNTGLEFFNSEIPYHASVPIKFSLYDEGGLKHQTLKNAINKVVLEIESSIEVKEGEVVEK